MTDVQPTSDDQVDIAAAIGTVVTVALYPAVSRAVRAAIELDVPDRLADGPLSVAELAEQCQVRTRRLRQVLRTAATTGLFASLPDDRFELTPAGQVLLKNHPTAARDIVPAHVSPAYQQSLDRLVDSMRTGESGIQLSRGEGLFDYYSERPDEQGWFNRMMIAYLADTPKMIAAAYDFAGGGTVVDCGGGLGAQLAEILTAHPELSGTLFELPSVIAEGARTDRSAFGDRWSEESGDFFRSVPAGRDFYVLSHIIHDWDDEQAIQILRNCVAAAAPGARFVLVEEIVPEGDEPNQVKMLDVALIAVLGSGERTLAEFDALFEAAGLRRTRVVGTESTVSAIEAVRVDE